MDNIHEIQQYTTYKLFWIFMYSMFWNMIETEGTQKKSEQLNIEMIFSLMIWPRRVPRARHRSAVHK